MNPKVDAFIERAGQWQAEFEQLRAIVLESQLAEELKWGVPCYTLEGKNIVLMHGFKEYCALLFVKGALLKDAKGILIIQTENVQSARQVRFKSVKEIAKLRSTLKAYIREAIEAEKSGLKVAMKPTAEFKMPDEFRSALDENPALQKAFDALTPGRQRAYLLYFSAPKQSKTRLSRIEKYTQPILKGKGLND
ncbi:MAG: YdeI/OmpD-associated family protein [Chloroflexi bacterium]|nr:YdeI/OmpD-associated family protein [Chloroflexota bacterium]